MELIQLTNGVAVNIQFISHVMMGAAGWTVWIVGNPQPVGLATPPAVVRLQQFLHRP